MMKTERFMLMIATLLFICVSLSSAALAARQDGEPVWTGSVGFSNGIYVQMGHGTIPPDAADLKLSKNSTEAGSTATSPDNSFRRILKLSDGRAVVYEVLINPLEGHKQFEVRLRALSPTAAQAKKWDIDLARVETDFLKNYSAPIIVGNGDTMAIDVLMNPQTGVKLVDYYRISNKPQVNRRNTGASATSARQFKTDEIELNVFQYELRLNGETVYKSSGGFRGRFIWVDVPRVGRFLFSLAQTEAEAAGFQPAAYVNEHQITFTHGGNRYELISEEPIVPGSGVFYLWMLHDPTFTVPSQQGLPPEFGGGDPGRYGRFGAADNIAPVKKRD
jgi:hypothetical protein